MELVVINGFDRSGSSYIGGLLSQHPEVNYFFQPFSSTAIHKTQYEVWGHGFSAPGPESFLRGIQDGRVDRDVLASDWFDRCSDYDLDAGRRVALVKETKLHTKIGWLKQEFPQAAVYGIWRDPRAILFSLMRNGFHLKWYGHDAFRRASRLIREQDRLECLAGFLHKPMSAEAQMALVLAARTRMMALDLDHDEWLVYERISEDPNAGLRQLCERLGLEEFDFRPLNEKDYNVTGRPFRGRELWRKHLPRSVLMEVEPVFNAMEYKINVA